MVYINRPKQTHINNLLLPQSHYQRNSWTSLKPSLKNQSTAWEISTQTTESISKFYKQWKLKSYHKPHSADSSTTSSNHGNRSYTRKISRYTSWYTFLVIWLFTCTSSFQTLFFHSRDTIAAKCFHSVTW